MHVLIADTLAPEAREGLEALGLRVTEAPELGPETLPGALDGVHILVVCDTAVTARAFEAASELAVIVRAGHGPGPIDVAAASARGVWVAHCPAWDAAARAELALGGLIALDRGLAGEPGMRRGLAGLKIGLVGFGPEAQKLAAAARALGLGVIVHAGDLTRARASEHGVQHARDLDSLFAVADVVSVQREWAGPQPVATAARLDALAGGTLVMVAGPAANACDLQALAQRVEAGRLRAVIDGLDTDDPIQARVAALEGVLATDGIASDTAQARSAAASEVVAIVNAYLVEDRVPHAVNVQATPEGAATLILRHQTKLGLLAEVLRVLAEEGLRVTGMRSAAFDGGCAACTYVHLAGVPSPSVIQRLSRKDALVHVEAVEARRG